MSALWIERFPALASGQRTGPNQEENGHFSVPLPWMYETVFQPFRSAEGNCRPADEFYDLRIAVSGPVLSAERSTGAPNARSVVSPSRTSRHDHRQVVRIVFIAIPH